MICTFYSYKGGVGRSMALANVADVLSRRGLKVLMIDFDLEAPGLEQFFYRGDEREQRDAVRRQPGLLDLLLAYKEAMSVTGGGDDFREIGRYIATIFPRRPQGGRLDLLPAGQRLTAEQLARYALALRSFDWQDFYFNWEGDLFFEWLRRALGSAGYDLVLIDSRTGVTEMGGICGYQLADVIIMMCGANHQNVDGTWSMLEDFRSQPVEGLRRGRPIEIVVVPARVEQRAPTLLTEFFERFDAHFGDLLPARLADAGIGFRDLTIPYDPQFAFEERVARNPEEKAAKEKKAKEVLAKAKKGNFEALAKEFGEDPTKDRGGDLGYFTKGRMVKPFEDAVFALKEGEISEPIRTDFGLHIIQLTSIKPASVKSFDEVRGQIESELKGQAAARKFAELAEAFSNVVYEQPDSLKPAAEQFKLEIHTTDWISRGAAAPAPFDQKRLLEAVFSSDVLENHHNTEAIDLGDARLIAARVLSHEPAKLRPLAEVRDSIVATLTLEQAGKAAVSAGEAALEGLRKGQGASIDFGAAQSVRRAGASLSGPELRAIFSAPADKLPAYAGASTPDGGYAIFEVVEVKRETIAKDDPRVSALRRQYEQLIGERDLSVFLKALRKTYGVEVHNAPLQQS